MLKVNLLSPVYLFYLPSQTTDGPRPSGLDERVAPLSSLFRSRLQVQRRLHPQFCSMTLSYFLVLNKLWVVNSSDEGATYLSNHTEHFWTRRKKSLFLPSLVKLCAVDSRYEGAAHVHATSKTTTTVRFLFILLKEYFQLHPGTEHLMWYLERPCFN